MGLDVSHGCWRGAYSAFSRWRNQLAEAAGYHVAKIDWGDGYAHEQPLVDWGHLPESTLHGEWPDGPPDDPFMIIIAHSDCDGMIMHEHTALLADRLEELIPLLPDEVAPGHIGHWHEKTQEFVDGLRAAHEAGEKVEFW